MKPKSSLITALIAVLTLTACTPAEPNSQATSTPDDDTIANSATSSQPVAKDRDERAVFSAVVRIDSCALLKSAASTLPGYSQRVQLTPGSPTGCTVTSADHAGAVDIWLDELSTSHRLQARLTSLGGAKAYVVRTATCRIYLPVSFTLALAFGMDGFPGENQCEPGEKFVAAAAAVLAHPERIQTEPRWDPCDLLRAAIGDENGHYRSGSQVTILDDCAKDKTEAWLIFDYANPGVDTEVVKWTKDTVGNTEVWVWKHSDGCNVEWRAGPPRYQSQVGLRAHIGSPTCEGAKRLAGSVMALLAQDPPDDVPPQRPLLYKPDEPDMPR